MTFFFLILWNDAECSSLLASLNSDSWILLIPFNNVYLILVRLDVL